MTVPPDIKQKIEILFPDERDKAHVQQLLAALWEAKLTVGPHQLARSVLVISRGDLEKLKQALGKAQIDPRDVIVEADALLGSPGHYLTQPFEY